jgi:hypothetical protein
MIERKIVLGLITSTEYIQRIRDKWDLSLISSATAKMLASWCIEYYDKYGKAPLRDLETIFYEKKANGLPEEIADEIETEIMPQLSDEYFAEEFKVEYIFDKTIEHFAKRRLLILGKQLTDLVEIGDIAGAEKLATDYEPHTGGNTENNNETGFNAYEATQMEIKEIEWLIEDLIPKGLTVFAGQSKLGKSFFVLNMMVNLAKNSKMFGDGMTTGFRGHSGQILYLDLEDPQARIVKRLHDIAPSPSERLINLDIKLEWKPLQAGGLKQLEDWIKSVNNPKLIVIDVMAKVWNMKTGTSGGRQYSEEYREWGPLADLAHKYNISIIAITHAKKTKEADVFAEILGGAGTQGPADNLMVLSRHPKNYDQRILAIRGKDVEEQHLVFEVTNEGASWHCLGELEEVQKTAERQSIYNYLSAAGAKTFNELKQAAKDGEIDVSVNSINTILRKMVYERELEQDKRRGMYMVVGTRSEQDKQINASIAETIQVGKHS